MVYNEYKENIMKAVSYVNNYNENASVSYVQNEGGAFPYRT